MALGRVGLSEYLNMPDDNQKMMIRLILTSKEFIWQVGGFFCFQVLQQRQEPWKYIPATLGLKPSSLMYHIK